MALKQCVIQYNLTVYQFRTVDAGLFLSVPEIASPTCLNPFVGNNLDIGRHYDDDGLRPAIISWVPTSFLD